MANQRFSVLQARAVEDKRISNSQFRTLAALGMFGDKAGWCFPKLATLAEIIGKTKQAVGKDILALCALGYIEIYHQSRPDGGRSSSKYRIVFDTPVNPTFTGNQPGIDTPSTPEVDAPSTPEVDALTPYVNAPIEIKLSVMDKFLQIAKVPIDGVDKLEELEYLEKAYPDTFWDALTWAASTNPPPSNAMRYIKMLGTALPRWKVKQEIAPAKKRKQGKQTIQLPDGTIVEADQ